MDMDRDQIYSKHILKAIEGINEFLNGMTFDIFAKDLKTQLAVTRELEIIGEATKRLSEEFKAQRGHIPWKKIAGMRDFLIHDYMNVDLGEVWKTAIEDIEELKSVLT